MGIYYSAHLMLGIEASVRDDEEVGIEERDENTEAFTVMSIDDDISEYLKNKFPKNENVKLIVFDPTYKQGEREYDSLSLFIGYEIGRTDDMTNTLDVDSLQGNIIQANLIIDNDFILDMEEKFPQLQWGSIELRNIISVG